MDDGAFSFSFFLRSAMQTWRCLGMACWLFIVLILVFFQTAETNSLQYHSVCPRPQLLESIRDRYACPLTSIKSRVSEASLPMDIQINGASLGKGWNLNHGDIQTAVLFYADWCPFSGSLGAMFDTMSVLFPSIHHVAVNGSGLCSSELTYYKVRSFPALFLLNANSRIRYRGPRTIKALCNFYKDVTGLQPIEVYMDLEVMTEGASMTALANGSPAEESDRRGQLWYVRKRFKEDRYLVLAVLFLLLRGCTYVLPKVVCSIRECEVWRRTVITRAALPRDLLRHAQGRWRIAETGTRVAVDRGKGRIESSFDDCSAATRIGLSSLSPVTLTEGSSSHSGLLLADGCAGPF